MSSLALTALLGAAVGLVMALTGAGGGVLAVPLLVFALHMSVQQAAPVAMVAVCAAATLGAVLGLRQGIVRYRAAGLIGTLAMLTAPVGVALAHRLPARPLLLGFAALLLWTAWRMWRASQPAAWASAERRDPPCQVDPHRHRLHWTAPCAWALGATGAASGLMTGLLGVGGGFVIVPALTRHTDLDSRSIAATSLAVIALATLSGMVAASGLGTLPWPEAAAFGAGAVAALAAGHRLAHHLPAAALQRSFAAVGVAVAALMLLRGLGVPSA